ncbi:hypothetical protein GCM10022381_28280 [Leifsonia kafniensis]|uniref:HTH tetR-type domain-containing protein n=1 Tax=Leifsonia kafniensis TaxID=475957 RepID=A0ABP7KQ29_9MICO
MVQVNDQPGPLPGENLRDRQKRLTRRRLVDCAFALFQDRGYQATTVENVSDAAGSSRATFYLHFKSMVDVALELMAEAEPDIVESYRRMDGFIDPSIEELREWAGGVLVMWRRHKVRFEALEQVLATESSVSAHWLASMAHSIEAMPKYLARWEATGRGEHGRLRLMTLIMQHERLCYFSVVREAPLSEADLVNVLSEQAWVLLRQDPNQSTPTF